MGHPRAGEDVRAYANTEKLSIEEAARNMRYRILWAMYENSAYRNLHHWSKSYKVAYGLYRYIRAIYNPSYRLGEFWKAHLLAGKLDADAGDGEAVPSALPIITSRICRRCSTTCR